MHKENAPLRLIISGINHPTENIAEFTEKELEQHVPLNEKLLFSRTKRIIERTSVVGIDGFGLLSNACLHASKPSFLGTPGYKPFTSIMLH
jgi:hypothetical protein